MTRYAALAVLLMACSAEAIEDGQSYGRLSPDERAAYIRGVVDTLIVDAMEEARHGDLAANFLLECRKQRAPGYSVVQTIAEDMLKIDPQVPMPLVISGAMGEACSRVLPPNSGLK